MAVDCKVSRWLLIIRSAVAVDFKASGRFLINEASVWLLINEVSGWPLIYEVSGWLLV